MVDVICFLCMEKNMSSPSSALKAHVSVLLSQVPAGLVRHMEPSLSLLEAIDLILRGAQNLVVPIKSNSRKKITSEIIKWPHHSQGPRLLIQMPAVGDQHQWDREYTEL
ncbi:hypothetical protein RJ639_031768 [Escallonia herrerae]|uniref:Uncharacterized protein n=1 Tax=Escallonia herrerae TaxID=1293975 RepID=A0AA89BMK6_9ASTE|nr:hypothetical protein RJ639_031768 [Escallonia herrerae]